MTEECWIPTDGGDGVAYLNFNDDGIATITRECLAILMERAGFVRVDKL